MSTAASSLAGGARATSPSPSRRPSESSAEERCRTPRGAVLAQSAKSFMNLPIGRLRRKPLSKFLRAAAGPYRIRHKTEVRNPEIGAVCGSFGVARPLQDRNAAVRTQVAEHLSFNRGRAFGPEPYGARNNVSRRGMGIWWVTFLVRGFAVRIGFTPFLGRLRLRYFDCHCASLAVPTPRECFSPLTSHTTSPQSGVTEFTIF